MFQPEFKTIEPITVAFVAGTGPYAQIPDGYDRLYTWIAMHGHSPAPDGMPMAVYMTDPATVPEDMAVWELWAPVADEPEPAPADSDGLGIKRVEGGLVASAMHKGSYDEMGPLYTQLVSWISGQGYDIAGPGVEVYYSDPEETPAEETLTEVRFPVHRR
ncbi:MAG: AraC family transcriptional regulator [Coriobacteriia bacterium]